MHATLYRHFGGVKSVAVVVEDRKVLKTSGAADF
jgi:hypothetical protein